MRDRRGVGSGLLLVLVLVPLLFLTLMFMGEMAGVRLNFSTRWANSQKAMSLARSAVMRAASQFQTDRHLGEGRNLTVAFSPPELGEPDSQALFTFESNKTQPPFGQVDASTNNAWGDSSVAGVNGEPVPTGCLQLVGYGCCNGVVRRYEALMFESPYSRALASSGDIHSGGGLVVGGINGSLPVGAPGVLTANELVPATLLADGPDDSLGPALQLSGPATVVGDLRSVGSAVVTGVNQTGGQVISNADAEELPQIDVTTYDPVSQPYVQTLGNATYTTLRNYTGFVRRAGSVTFASNVQLYHALLYVDGDVEIDGALTGNGAVVSTGNIRILGGANFTATNLCAVVARGDVQLVGNGTQLSTFNGLVYAGGQGNLVAGSPNQDLTVANITIQGVAIAAGNASAGGASSMNVTNARMLYSPSGATLVVSPGFGTAQPLPSPGAKPGHRLVMVLFSPSGQPAVGPADFYNAIDGYNVKGVSVEYMDTPSGQIFATAQAAEAAGVINKAQLTQVGQASSSYLGQIRTELGGLQTQWSQTHSSVLESFNLDQFLQTLPSPQLVYRRG